MALKVLPEALAKDAGRIVRFQREAQVLASLNHPNITGVGNSPYHKLDAIRSFSVGKRYKKAWRDRMPVRHTLESVGPDVTFVMEVGRAGHLTSARLPDTVQ